MILRFRDLAGPVGSTVDAHSAIAQREGAVWWAWWHKPDEKIPRDVFAQFKQAIRDQGGLDIYLADSGRYLLYRAKLLEVRESDTEQPIPSPDAQTTPEYYNKSPYKAWFRLDSIEPVATVDAETELHKWSYDEVAGFTDDPFSAAYQDKQLFSLKEMLHRRHRTIYFIQRYEPRRHRRHLVETLPGVQPRNFVTTPILGHSSFVLHLSDLHFGKEHRFSLQEEPGRKTLARLIIDDLRNEVGLGAPAGVLITGDLTWQAKKDEFRMALAFIERLGSEFSLESSTHFMLIPGNHDIRWVDDPTVKQTKVRFPPEKAKKAFSEFYGEFFGIPPSEFFSEGMWFLLNNYATVNVIGVNSSELEQTHFAGYGYVKDEQLNLT